MIFFIKTCILVGLSTCIELYVAVSYSSMVHDITQHYYKDIIIHQTVSSFKSFRLDESAVTDVGLGHLGEVLKTKDCKIQELR